MIVSLFPVNAIWVNSYEAAALLILQKKLDAYWSNVDEDN